MPQTKTPCNNPSEYTLQSVHPEEVALMCLSAALVVPPGADAGWGLGFDSQAAQAQLAGLLLDELLDDTSPRCTPLGDLVVRLHAELGAAGPVLAASMLTTLGVRCVCARVCEGGLRLFLASDCASLPRNPSRPSKLLSCAQHIRTTHRRSSCPTTSRASSTASSERQRAAWLWKRPRSCGRLGGARRVCRAGHHLSQKSYLDRPNPLNNASPQKRSLLVACGTAPVDATVQCIAGIDPRSALGLFIRRACAAFAAGDCAARARLVRRLHAALRGAEARVGTALAGGGGGSGGGAGALTAVLSDPEAARALAQSHALLRAALARIDAQLRGAEEELGPVAYAFGGEAACGADEFDDADAWDDAAGAGAGPSAAAPPLRGGDRLALHVLRRIEDAQARPAGCPPPPRQPRAEGTAAAGQLQGPASSGGGGGGGGE